MFNICLLGINPLNPIDMKKIILILLLLPLLASSQNWIEKGTVWHYDQVMNGIGFHKFMYNEDTLIDGHLCQKIIDSCFTFFEQPNGVVLYAGVTDGPTHYTYNNNDSVFCYRDSTFYLLYNFGAHIGDSWVISTDTMGGCDTSVVMVVDTGSMVINNEIKRWVDLTTNSGAGFILNGRILEGVGTIDGFNVVSPLFAVDIPCDTNIIICFYFYHFKCFSRNDTLIYNPSGKDCEYYLIHSAIDELNSTNKIKIYPNPARNQISFVFGSENTMDIEMLYIYNSMGQLNKQHSLKKNEQVFQLNISDLRSGIYYYQIMGIDKAMQYSGKFIKE